MISNFVNKTWFSHYLHCQWIIYDNGTEFKLHSEALCESYGVKCKQINAKNPQANAILEQVHQVLTLMLHTAEMDIAKTVDTSDMDVFLTNAKWSIHSTYHHQVQTYLVGTCCSIPPSLLTLEQNRRYRRHQTNLNTEQGNHSCHDWDYKVGDLFRNDGILCKADSWYESDPWSNTSVHTNGTIRDQHRTNLNDSTSEEPHPFSTIKCHQL